VTNVPLSLEEIGGKRPYAPSIDRIDNSKGYAFGERLHRVLSGECSHECVGRKGTPEHARKLRSNRQKEIILDNATQVTEIKEE